MWFPLVVCLDPGGQLSKSGHGESLNNREHDAINNRGHAQDIGPQLGDRVIGAGDIDGDGFNDILVRAARVPVHVGRAGGPGTVYLFRGGATINPTPHWTLVGAGVLQYVEFGIGLAMIGGPGPRYF